MNFTNPHSNGIENSLKQLNTNPEAFETYARENFGMHKEGETVTFIEFEDSLMSDVKKRSYPHGKVVEPLYTSSPDNNVGFRNHLRTTMQEHLVEKEIIANDWAHNRLQQGASGLLFYLTDEQYLPRIIKGIKLEYISLGLVVEGSGPAVMEALLHHAHNEIIPVQKLRGFINIDPIEIAARTGIWHENKMYELGGIISLDAKAHEIHVLQCQFLRFLWCFNHHAIGVGLSALRFLFIQFCGCWTFSILDSLVLRYLYVRRDCQT